MAARRRCSRFALTLLALVPLDRMTVSATLATVALYPAALRVWNAVTAGYDFGITWRYSIAFGPLLVWLALPVLSPSPLAADNRVERQHPGSIDIALADRPSSARRRPPAGHRRVGWRSPVACRVPP